ncbi:DUF4861 family protein [Duganella fentianensis]|uniref:DUF4861 family protein n=1 Tax=Duganella fentianensis TaxID=2692177 RepID=UPI0032B2C8C6
MRRILFMLSALPLCALGAERLSITASHALDAARPAETISVPWSAVAHALPGARLQQLVVKDGQGRALAYQVTNVAPLIKDPKNTGAAYGELLFQYSFAQGERSARFSVEKIDDVAPVFPVKAYGRYVQERLDDFAWENDLVAHRMYGPALAATVPGSNKEVLVTSGIDVWFKRVSYPIIDRWYNKGHDHYHVDEGEGMDMYSVGTSRGLGGTGVWDGQRLNVSRNYASWKVLANGPVRVVFEVTYDTWDGGGFPVAETKRIALDAGQQFNRVTSTFTSSVRPELQVAVGLGKATSDKGQDPRITLRRDSDNHAVLLWFEQKTKGEYGSMIALPSVPVSFAEDDKNQLLLAHVKSGEPLHYLSGAAWNKAAPYQSMADWQAAAAAFIARERNPLQISTEAQH